MTDSIEKLIEEAEEECQKCDELLYGESLKEEKVEVPVEPLLTPMEIIYKRLLETKPGGMTALSPEEVALVDKESTRRAISQVNPGIFIIWKEKE